MKLTVFAKRRTTIEGKTFYAYLSTLTKKDGTQLKTAVKFTEEAGAPKPELCPMNILVDKSRANLSTRTYIDPRTGDEGTSYVLWVSAWSRGEDYVDHSLDDFE